MHFGACFHRFRARFHRFRARFHRLGINEMRIRKERYGLSVENTSV